MEIINKTGLCKELCPKAPLQCCFDKGHKGNHQALGDEPYFFHLLNREVLYAEWNDKEIVKLDETWAKSIGLK